MRSLTLCSKPAAMMQPSRCVTGAYTWSSAAWLHAKDLRADVRSLDILNRAQDGVLRVDECDLITASEIARKIDRSRQQVHQYMTGERGPGGFPAPECYLSEKKPLWAWCAVSYWLVQNDLLKPEVSWNAEVVAAINNALEDLRRYRRHPELVRELNAVLGIPTEPVV